MPEGFEPPSSFSGDGWRLEPLGPEHNEADHEAWTSSVDHIRATPGFVGRRWPHPMTIGENLDDLRQHADGFANRREFTYTVLDDADDVIGCVYVLPDLEHDRLDAAYLRCWVRADHRELDGRLRSTVLTWLREDWPFRNVRVDTPGIVAEP